MLTVALFSHSRYLCGAERMLLNLALLLEQTGKMRPVLLSPGEGELSGEARRQGVECRIVPQPPWYLLQPGDLRDYCRGAAECTAALKRTLVEVNSDAVIVNTMTNVPAMLAAVALDLPSLLWVHGVIDSLLVPERSSEFTTPHDELLVQSATRVMALSNYTSEFCTRVLRRKQLDVVHNWTQVDPHFAPAVEKYHSRRFACLNTFDPHKGHATLLEAAALLKKRKRLFEIDLYGDGQVRGEMQRRCSAMGLDDCVQFQGRTMNVHAVYDPALAVVNPAQVEPFGMTLIEAMARKTPVVATRSGGPEDIVRDGETGFLVNRGDAAALADRMEALLESPALAQRQGEAGFRRVLEHFQESAARAVIEPIIDEAVRDFRGYDPAVKAMTNIYQLWLGQAMPVSIFAPPASASAPSPMRKASRLARGGVRGAKALAKRLLASFGARVAASSVAVASSIANPLPGPIGAKASLGPQGKPRNFRQLGSKARYRVVPGQGNWAGLDVLLSGGPLSSAGRLRLNVRSTSGQVVRDAVGPLTCAGDQGWLGFRFPPIVNAAGVAFDVELVSEGSAAARAVRICESDVSESTHPATAARLRLPWQERRSIAQHGTPKQTTQPAAARAGRRTSPAPVHHRRRRRFH